MAAVLQTGSHLIKLSGEREDERKSKVGGGEMERVATGKTDREGRMSAVELRGD